MAYNTQGQYGGPQRPHLAQPQDGRAEYWQEESYVQDSQSYGYDYNDPRNQQYPPGSAQQYPPQSSIRKGPPLQQRPYEVQPQPRARPPPQQMQRPMNAPPQEYFEPSYQEPQRFPDQNMARRPQGNRPSDQYSYNPQQRNGGSFDQPRRNLGGQGSYQPQRGPQNGYMAPENGRPAPQRSYSDGGGNQKQTYNQSGAEYVNGGPVAYNESNGGSGQGDRTGRGRKPSKDGALQSQTSPETLSWDNPFPSFPTAKKKPSRGDGDNSRPQTASSRRSHESSNSQSKLSNRARTSGNGLQPADDSYTNNEIHAQGHRPHTSHEISQVDRTQQLYQGSNSARPSHVVNQFEQPRPDTAPPNQANYSGVPQAIPLSALKGAPGVLPQRSNTLPDAIPKGVGHTDMPYRPIGAAASQGGNSNGQRGPQTELVQSNQQAYRLGPNGTSTPQSSQTYHELDGGTNNFPSELAADVPEDSYDGDLFDSYYDGPGEDNSADRGLYSPRSDDMPNFDALSVEPHQSSGPVGDLHLQTRDPASFPLTNNAVDRGRQNDLVPMNDREQNTSRSRSQPNSRQPQAHGVSYPDQAYGSGPNGVPPMPQMNAQAPPAGYGSRPPNGQYGNGAPLQNGQRPYQQMRPQYPGPARGPPPQNMRQDGTYGGPGMPGVNMKVPMPGPMPGPNVGPRRPGGPGLPPLADASRFRGGPGAGPSPINRNGPATPTATNPPNPDALPSHAAPVRPGLTPPNNGQAPKPPPIRQYNSNPSPVPQPINSQGPPKSSPGTASTGLVTHEEIQRLRQKVQNAPMDSKTKLLLAQKLVEAASVLANSSDPKIRNKDRERYFNEAVKLVKYGVANGYAEAMFYMADCYSSGGMALPVDPREAFNLYMSAAKLNHPQSAYRVAVCCEMGQDEGGGTRRDPPKAIQWYKRAATLGDTPAMYKMGIIQLKGLLGQPKNQKDAIVWLKRAAERADEDNPHALHELALLYESANNNDNVIRDEAYALQLFTQAANLGYKFSQYRLGVAYEYGQLGCPVDPRQSIAWYSKAAVQEEHQSELALSGWYLTGSQGILEQSDTEAYLWARKAAQAGLAKAEYAMGYFTEVGIGAPANMDDAKRWYWKASAQNFLKARERLEDLRKGGAQRQKERVSRSNMKKQSDADCSIM